jgi:hypothetical protein
MGLNDEKKEKRYFFGHLVPSTEVLGYDYSVPPGRTATAKGRMIPA